MAYIRKRLGKWQCVVRMKGHPTTTKTFLMKKDAQLWGKNSELKFFCEDNDILLNLQLLVLLVFPFKNLIFLMEKMEMCLHYANHLTTYNSIHFF